MSTATVIGSDDLDGVAKQFAQWHYLQVKQFKHDQLAFKGKKVSSKYMQRKLRKKA